MRTASRYLKRWGFTPQKPLRRALRARSGGRGAAGSARSIRRSPGGPGPNMPRFTGPINSARSDHQAGRSYGRRGRTPVIPGTGQRLPERT
ncbi:MAG: winged helix-turn-helix domain-containing protein [Phycisphaerales bacterium]|nr:winged helix-turn-helix domain-containing protein [Phycisphaerales bacterium]